MTYPPPPGPQQPSAPQTPAPQQYASPQQYAAPAQYASGYAAPRTPSALGLSPGRSLASAVGVFLGGYLLLSALTGGLVQSLASILPVRAHPGVPASIVTLDVLQFLVAIAVVVLSLLLTRGPIVGRVMGGALVAVVLLVHAIFLTERAFGDVSIPREILIPFNAVFVNSWFLVVLIVGVAWLLARGARLGWLAILGTVVLIPLPVVFQLNGVEFGVLALVMYALSAVVGGAIIAAGRPLRN